MKVNFINTPYLVTISVLITQKLFGKNGKMLVTRHMLVEKTNTPEVHLYGKIKY